MAKSEFRKPTLPQFLSGAALAAFLLFAASASAHHLSAVWRSAQQTNAQANEVSGKVIAIAPDKKSISLEVTDRNNASTMQFAIDENTRVTGRVSVGNIATIQYESANDGKLLALNISPKTQTQ
jgi:starvation-inducible outer membrane lipoprotein